MVYPNTTGDNQIASEKRYPVDYSHFNINGRVFGAVGAPEDPDLASIYHVGLDTVIGRTHPSSWPLPLSCRPSSSSTGKTICRGPPWPALSR